MFESLVIFSDEGVCSNDPRIRKVACTIPESMVVKNGVSWRKYYLPGPYFSLFFLFFSILIRSSLPYISIRPVNTTVLSCKDIRSQGSACYLIRQLHRRGKPL
jgi:hypothetical protein